MKVETTAQHQVMASTAKWVAILIALGHLVDGYDLLVMGAAMLFLKPAFHLSNSMTGFLSSASFIGAAIGLLIFGPITDRLGRRAIFVFNLIVFVGGAIFSAFITNVTELLIARILIGIAVGAEIPASMAFLAEIAPADQRGRYMGVLPNVMWVLGAALSTALGMFLMDKGPEVWRWLFGIGAVPALLVLLGRQALPESPRWLINKGDIQGAMQASKKLGIAMPPVTKKVEESRFSELFSPMYRRRSIVVALVFGFNCLAGPITTLATPYILRFGGMLSVKSSLSFSFGIYLVELLGILTAYFLIDRVSRRKLGYFSIGGAGVMAVLMGAFGFNSSGAVLTTLYFLLAYVLWCGSALLVWVWGSELFPTRIRGAGQGLCNATCRIAIAINTFIVPVGIASFGVKTLVVLFAVPLFLMVALIATHPMFETSGKGLEEISE